ncbi:ATP-binding cassette domain-containing protein [Enterococcus ureilyticus]|nr:ATP-binding cassette domain-containing protein [Enterococcus ureilyticus]MBO0445705.1 ATP-binding cassette domain-containing protein [Enterococcus ureilyticus]
MVRVENITYYISAQKKIEQFTYDMASHSLTLIVGNNGAGKSTLLKLMAGILTPECGQIFQTEKVSYVPDSSENYFKGVTPLFYFNFLRSEFRIEKKFFNSRLVELMRNFNFSERLMTSEMGSLSLGEKKKVMLIGAFLNDPQLYLMDEPTSGLDQESLSNLLQEIEKERQKDKKFIIISHEHAELFQQVDEMIQL